MPFVPVPDCVKAEFIYTADGQTCENVHYFEMGGPFSPVQFGAFGDTLVAWWKTWFVNMYPATVTLQEIVLTDMTFQAAPGAIFTAGLPVVCTRAGAQLPNNVALCFTKRTTLRGRSYRGRTYFGPLTETDVTAHIANASIIDGMITRMEDLRVMDVGADTWQMVIVSTRANNDWRTEGLTTPVNSISTDGIVDSQRRRLPGRGK